MAQEHAALFAVRRCPFLGELATRHGEQYAASIACNPLRPAQVGSSAPRSPICVDSDDDLDLVATFELFHGPRSGLVPLTGFEDKARRLSSASSGGSCPFGRGSSTSSNLVPPPAACSSETLAAAPAPSRSSPLPLASMSMGFGVREREAHHPGLRADSRRCARNWGATALPAHFDSPPPGPPPRNTQPKN